MVEIGNDGYAMYIATCTNTMSQINERRSLQNKREGQLPVVARRREIRYYGRRRADSSHKSAGLNSSHPEPETADGQSGLGHVRKLMIGCYYQITRLTVRRL